MKLIDMEETENGYIVKVRIFNKGMNSTKTYLIETLDTEVVGIKFTNILKALEEV